ncbi:lipoprotein [Sulfurihydrogenibium sp.]|uniref:lipoprotein n=1 Tax=Sulfurihydrogenibium sp. TaxID=2053621 RepID=UPI002632139A|nr:lipoprotein [Sulfurihydrogenibium sp.]
MKKFLFLIGLVALLSSCASNEVVIQPNAPVSFIAKTERKGDYVFIVPSNFQLIESESLIFENIGIYRAYLIYKGEGFIQDLVNFFDREMPKNGWTKFSALVGRDALLSYKKDNQIIVIKIQYGLTNTYIKMILTR